MARAPSPAREARALPETAAIHPSIADASLGGLRAQSQGEPQVKVQRDWPPERESPLRLQPSPRLRPPPLSFSLPLPPRLLPDRHLLPRLPPDECRDNNRSTSPARLFA